MTKEPNEATRQAIQEAEDILNPKPVAWRKAIYDDDNEFIGWWYFETPIFNGEPLYLGRTN